MTIPTLDLAGIGAGPFNLSVAALMEKLPHMKAAFFDRKAQFNWHPGLMLSHANLQTSWMKDLVTPVDPTSGYSFLNYLVNHERFYAFVNADQDAITRDEFADYLGWAAKRLNNLRFNHQVEEIHWDGDLFRIETSQGVFRAKNLSVGCGVRPHVPRFVSHWLGEKAFHGYGINKRSMNLAGQRVAVVGGGQTGAEVVLHLLEHHGQMASLHWISRRPNLEPLDETPFSNEYFSPSYVDQFFHISQERKPHVVAYQKLTSDGISPATLKLLYQRLYQQRITTRSVCQPVILPDRELVGGEARHEGFKLELHNRFHDVFEDLAADIVIFCTGFNAPMPDCMEPLFHRLQWGPQGQPLLDRNYRMLWDGPEDRQIFAVNAGKFTHGIADAQTSLMAHRSATIINALANEEVYQTQNTGLVHWGSLVADHKKSNAASMNLVAH